MKNERANPGFRDWRRDVEIFEKLDTDFEIEVYEIWSNPGAKLDYVKGEVAPKLKIVGYEKLSSFCMFLYWAYKLRNLGAKTMGAGSWGFWKDELSLTKKNKKQTERRWIKIFYLTRNVST